MISPLTARENRDLAEKWRTDLIDAMEHSATRERLGSEVADRQLAYAHAAGVIALDGTKVHKGYSSISEPGDEEGAGLHLVPVPPGLPKDYRLELSTRDGIGKYRFGDLGRSTTTSALHISSVDTPRVDLIAFPTHGKKLLKLHRAATHLHEGVHAAQLRRRGYNLKENKRLAVRALKEGEAYDVEFGFADVVFGGILSDVVADTSARGLGFRGIYNKRLNSGLPEHVTNALQQHNGALDAAIINTAYGYKPDGLTEPPRDVVKAYKRAGLI